MIFFILLAYLGGLITIASPCILPVIPFVFARSDRPFRSSGLPLLLGMTLAFAAVSAVASVGGGWVVRANQAGRDAALVLLALFAVTMLSPSLAERLTRPLVRLGGRLSSDSRGGFAQSLLLGVATGMLWAPCAGPILGAILSAAALGGSGAGTVALLLAYGLGAATSLGAVLLGGQRVLNRMKRSLGLEEQIRRGLGVLILIGVAVVALGLDRGVLTRLSEGSTSNLEQSLVDRLHPRAEPAGHAASSHPGEALADEGPLPALPAAADWVNSPPLTKADLRGKIVLIDFWTYSCINCLRTLPSVKSWYDTYKKDGFIVIGVHTPEFAFERERANVVAAIAQLHIPYPVAQDNDYAIWNAFHNEYWPAHYLIDGEGRIRYHHFGEGDEAQTESAIRSLLAENGARVGARAHMSAGRGALAAADDADDQSEETYLGKSRAQNYDGTVAASELAARERRLGSGHWLLSGAWLRDGEKAALHGPGSISFRFHARDAHLVLGPAVDARPAPFEVYLDGKLATSALGADLDAHAAGMVREQRLYQLIRQHGRVTDHVLRIVFPRGGVGAFAFTFG